MNKILLSTALVSMLAGGAANVSAQELKSVGFDDVMFYDAEEDDNVPVGGHFMHVSANGKYAVGYDDAGLTTNIGNPFLWLRSDPEDLVQLCTTVNRVTANDVTDDGIIVGSFEQRDDPETQAVCYPGWRTIEGDWNRLPVPDKYSVYYSTTEDFMSTARAVTPDGKYIAGHIPYTMGYKEIGGMKLEKVHTAPIVWEKQGDQYVIKDVYVNPGAAGKSMLYKDGELVAVEDSVTDNEFIVTDISNDGTLIVGQNTSGCGGFNPAFFRNGVLVQLFQCGEEVTYDDEGNTSEANFNGGRIEGIDGKNNMYGWYMDADLNTAYFVYTADGKLEYTNVLATCADNNGKAYGTANFGNCYDCSEDGKVLVGSKVMTTEFAQYEVPALAYDDTATGIGSLAQAKTGVVYHGGNTVYVTGEYSKAELFNTNGMRIATAGQGSTLNLSGCPKGAYIVKVTTDKGVQTVKIAK